MKLNAENSMAIMLVAQEIMDSGQLWVTLSGEEYYIPELIRQLQSLIDFDKNKKPITSKKEKIQYNN